MPPDIAVSTKDFDRLESKFDKMAEAVEQLVLIEERQTIHSGRLSKIEDRMTAMESKVAVVDGRIDKWLNMSMGAWTVLVLAFEALKFWGKS